MTVLPSTLLQLFVVQHARLAPLYDPGEQVAAHDKKVLVAPDELVLLPV